jgi:hypothetical protein
VVTRRVSGPYELAGDALDHAGVGPGAAVPGGAGVAAALGELKALDLLGDLLRVLQGLGPGLVAGGVFAGSDAAGAGQGR